VTSCPACGATITVAVDNTTGERVPLEIHTDASSDAPRYRVVASEQPIKVERVNDGAYGDFYPDHRHECPDFPG
jgi:hypothetical protein